MILSNCVDVLLLVGAEMSNNVFVCWRQKMPCPHFRNTPSYYTAFLRRNLASSCLKLISLVEDSVAASTSDSFRVLKF